MNTEDCITIVCESNLNVHTVDGRPVKVKIAGQGFELDVKHNEGPMAFIVTIGGSRFNFSIDPEHDCRIDGIFELLPNPLAGGREITGPWIRELRIPKDHGVLAFLKW